MRKKKKQNNPIEQKEDDFWEVVWPELKPWQRMVALPASIYSHWHNERKTGGELPQAHWFTLVAGFCLRPFVVVMLWYAYLKKTNFFDKYKNELKDALKGRK